MSHRTSDMFDLRSFSAPRGAKLWPPTCTEENGTVNYRLSAVNDFEELMHFLLHLGWTGDSLGDFDPEEFSIALT